MRFMTVLKVVVVDVVESVAHGVCFVNVVYNLMIVQFRDYCSVRV